MTAAIIIVAIVVAIPGIGWALTGLRLGGYREGFTASEIHRDRLSAELRSLAKEDANEDERQSQIVKILNDRIKELEAEVDRRRRPGDARRRLRMLSEAKGPDRAPTDHDLPG